MITSEQQENTDEHTMNTAAAVFSLEKKKRICRRGDN